MQEGKNGVIRLLNTIRQNASDTNISRLAYILNYNEKQLKEDIEAISMVEVVKKGE